MTVKKALRLADEQRQALLSVIHNAYVHASMHIHIYIYTYAFFCVYIYASIHARPVAPTERRAWKREATPAGPAEP